jgi:hypothetical protein
MIDEFPGGGIDANETASAAAAANCWKGPTFMSVRFHARSLLFWRILMPR